MSGLYPCGATGLEELGQALVFEASNHPLIAPCNVSGVNTHNAALCGCFGAPAKKQSANSALLWSVQDLLIGLK